MTCISSGINEAKTTPLSFMEQYDGEWLIQAIHN